MFIDMFFFLLLFVFMVSKHRKKSQEDLVSKVPRFGKWTQPQGATISRFQFLKMSLCRKGHRSLSVGL
jgi:hypothetical protein